MDTTPNRAYPIPDAPESLFPQLRASLLAIDADVDGVVTPLTTKGDLYGYSTVAARIPVGTNGQVLTADSAQALGLKWANPAGGGDALTTSPLSQFASTTSAQLAGVISDETGFSTGAKAVFSIAPTIDAVSLTGLIDAGIPLINDLGIGTDTPTRFGLRSGTFASPSTSNLPVISVQTAGAPPTGGGGTNVPYYFGYYRKDGGTMPVTATLVVSSYSYDTAATPAQLNGIASFVNAVSGSTTQPFAFWGIAQIHDQNADQGCVGMELEVDSNTTNPAPALTSTNPDGFTIALNLVGGGTNTNKYNSAGILFQAADGNAFKTLIHVNNNSIAPGGYGLDFKYATRGLPIRLPNLGALSTGYIYGRNNADNADKKLLGITSADQVSIDGDGIGTTFGGNVLPGTNDGAALGSAAKQWSDLFLANGGIINWNDGENGPIAELVSTQTDSPATVITTLRVNQIGSHNSGLIIKSIAPTSFASDIELETYVGASRKGYLWATNSDIQFGVVNEIGRFTSTGLTIGVAGVTRGLLNLAGNTSGTVTIQPAAAAGTWTWTLPVDDGTIGQVLTTDGAGITSWTTVSGGSGANTALSNLASVAINTDLVGAVAGGMGIRGGSTANDDLILEGTTHATRTSSYVSIQPNGGNVGIGIAAALTTFQVMNATGGTIGFGLTGSPAWLPAKIESLNVGSFGGELVFYTHPANGGNDATVVEGMRLTNANNLTLVGSLTSNGNITVSNTAPSLILTDTTASAKSLTIAVDADVANFRESAGASGSLLALDLANNRAGIGTAAPNSPLSVSANSGTLPTAPAGTVAYFANANDANSFLTMDTYGAFHSDFLFRQARGTMSSPTATQSGDIIGQVQSRGYGSTGFVASSRASVRFSAGQNWSDSNQSAFISILTTPTNSATIAERVRITADGSVLLAMAGVLATNATDGFVYIPTCAGTPTGTPTTQTGMVPIIFDTTNAKLYVYTGGAWKGGTVPGAFI